MNSHTDSTLMIGASVGLCKTLTTLCASRKMNLLLVAPPGRNMRSAGSHVNKQHGVDVRVFETDLTENEPLHLLLKPGPFLPTLILPAESSHMNPGVKPVFLLRSTWRARPLKNPFMERQSPFRVAGINGLFPDANYTAPCRK